MEYLYIKSLQKTEKQTYGLLILSSVKGMKLPVGRVTLVNWVGLSSSGGRSSTDGAARATVIATATKMAGRRIWKQER